LCERLNRKDSNDVRVFVYSLSCSSCKYLSQLQQERGHDLVDHSFGAAQPVQRLKRHGRLLPHQRLRIAQGALDCGHLI